jgi:hypothetical protein
VRQNADLQDLPPSTTISSVPHPSHQPREQRVRWLKRRAEVLHCKHSSNPSEIKPQIIRLSQAFHPDFRDTCRGMEARRTARIDAGRIRVFGASRFRRMTRKPVHLKTTFFFRTLVFVWKFFRGDWEGGTVLRGRKTYPHGLRTGTTTLCLPNLFDMKEGSSALFHDLSLIVLRCPRKSHSARHH